MKLKNIWVVTFIYIFLSSVLLVLGSCHSNTASPYFPVEKEPASLYPVIAVRGWLILDNNCLRLKPFYCFGKGELLIWRYGYSLDVENGEIRVVDDESGKVLARVGDFVRLGGGQTSKEMAEKLIGGPLPDNCSGPYFLVGTIVTGN